MWLFAHAFELERTDDALTVAGMYRRRGLGGKLGVEGLDAELGKLLFDRLPQTRVSRRFEVEIRQGGPKIETGPTYHDRPVPFGQQGVDFRMSALGKLGDAI